MEMTENTQIQGGSAVQCARTIERRGEGKRYVYDRWQCRRMVKPPHTLCHDHRWSRCCEECAND